MANVAWDLSPPDQHSVGYPSFPRPPQSRPAPQWHSTLSTPYLPLTHVSFVVFETELVGIDGVEKPEKIVVKETEEKVAEKVEENIAGKVAEAVADAADAAKTFIADTDDAVQGHEEL